VQIVEELACNVASIVTMKYAIVHNAV